MEQKYRIANEYGAVMWDIEKILDAVRKDKNKFTLKEYDVNKLASENPFHGNEAHVMNTDITQPLIIVLLTENTEKLIDGNHRLQKALRSVVKTISAYCLSPDEHKKFIVDYDEQTYSDVVTHF